jgi:HEAT repeat protein
MSLFGAPDVLGLEARRDVEGLARALRYKSGNAGAEHQVVRAAAARALSRIGDARAVRPLIAALIDKDGSSVHSAEAEALGQIGDVRGVGPLVAVLAGIDSDSSLREAAIIALGEIGDASAVPPLIATLNDEIAMSALWRPSFRIWQTRTRTFAGRLPQRSESSATLVLPRP